MGSGLWLEQSDKPKPPIPSNLADAVLDEATLANASAAAAADAATAYCCYCLLLPLPILLLAMLLLLLILLLIPLLLLLLLLLLLTGNARGLDAIQTTKTTADNKTTPGSNKSKTYHE